MPGDATKKLHIRPEILELEAEMVRVRRDLHRHPELGFRERRTAGIVAETLRGLKIEVTEGVAQTGVVGLLEGGRPGPTVLVRADMDGLPLQEENPVEYASQEAQAMHACGHDAHVSIALAVARHLASRRERLGGRVKFVFQPAEEGPGGAQPMIGAGVLRNPDVDVALGLHVWNEMPVGWIGVQGGPMLAAADHFTLTIHGQGGHGAQPQRTVDPIVTAAHVVTALQSVVSRRTDPFQAAVVTLGAIHGGKAPNIIPERVVLDGTVRSLDAAVRDALPRHMEQIISGVADAFGATYELDYHRGYPPTVNDERVAEMVRRCADEAGCQTRAWVTMGGEDMSYFLNQIPGCFFFVGSTNAARDLVHPHHSPRFDIDEDAMLVGAEVMTRAVEQALESALPERAPAAAATR